MSGWRPAALLKKRLRRMCSVNFTKFLIIFLAEDIRIIFFILSFFHYIYLHSFFCIEYYRIPFIESIKSIEATAQRCSKFYNLMWWLPGFDSNFYVRYLRKSFL